MTIKKFNTIPLSTTEKEKKAEEFLGFLDRDNENKTFLSSKKIEKEQMKSFLFRIPHSLYSDLKEIAALTGISVNATCLELLRPHIKRKLKDLKNEI